MPKKKNAISNNWNELVRDKKSGELREAVPSDTPKKKKKKKEFDLRTFVWGNRNRTKSNETSVKAKDIPDTEYRETRNK